MPQEWCLAPELPTIEVATRVVLIVHHVERWKPTNTGRLVARMLTGSTIVVRGPRAIVPPAPPLPEGRRLVLFPSPDARPLDPGDAFRGPVVLVVPDGTWRQARRMPRREPAAQGAEVVTLPPGAPSTYRLRRGPNERALSTLEAVARALAILEDPSVGERMIAVLDRFVERQLSLRPPSPLG